MTDNIADGAPKTASEAITDLAVGNAIDTAIIAANAADTAKQQTDDLGAAMADVSANLHGKIIDTHNVINNLEDNTKWHAEKMTSLESGLQTVTQSQMESMERLGKLQAMMEDMAGLMALSASQVSRSQTQQQSNLPPQIQPAEVKKEVEVVRQVEEQQNKKRRRYL